MSARTVLAQTLAEGLPTYRVIDHSRVIDRVDTRTILVWQDGLSPHPPAGRDGVLVTLTVLVLTPHADVAQAEADLEDALLEVLGVLHPINWAVWTGADRGTFGADEYHGYKITVSAGGALTEQEETTP